MNEIVNKFLLVEYKFLPEMHLKQPKLQNTMDIKEVLLLWFISFLIKNKSSGVNNDINENEELAQELHKPIIKKFKKKKFIPHLKTIFGMMI